MLRLLPDAARIETPTAWTTPTETTPTETPPTEVTVEARWWQGFGDSELNRYVDAALIRNANVQIAATRVAAARAQLAAGRSRAAARPERWHGPGATP